MSNKKIRLSIIMTMIFITQIMTSGLSFAAVGSCSSLTNDPYSCITKDSKDIIGQEVTNGSDPIIQGAQEVAKQTKIYQGGLVEGANRTTVDGVILSRVQSFINYAISFLATVALIYLLYNGFILLINNSDDTQKKALSKIKTTARAIGGIGFSRFIVSTMFWIISKFVK